MPVVTCRTGPRWGSSVASPGLVVVAAAAAAVGVVAGAGVAGLGAVLWIRRRERANEEGTSAALIIFKWKAGSGLSEVSVHLCIYLHMLYTSCPRTVCTALIFFRNCCRALEPIYRGAIFMYSGGRIYSIRGI